MRPSASATATRLADYRERANMVRDKVVLSEWIGRKVELKRAGREFTGLCPFHNEKSPSFFVNDRKRFFHCFGCGAHGDAIAFVERLQGMGFADALALLESAHGLERFARATPAQRAIENDEARARREQREAEQVKEAAHKHALAGDIWSQAQPIQSNAVVDRYLRGRALVPPADYGLGDATINAGWPPALRYAPRAWHPYAEGTYPAMVSAITDALGNLLAVHQTFLAIGDRAVVTKASFKERRWAKLTLGRYYADPDAGRSSGGAIRLGEPAPSMTGAEGIETTLSAMQIWRRPGLCFVTSGNMPGVELPVGCSFFTYAADKDLKRQGERKAWQAARAQAFGRRIEVVVPKIAAAKGDFNDLLQARIAARAQGRAA
ncbi:MAG TPA: CHC2 zinc finger domain-containing protein [Vineibacter sp.]|nr:CHC2 zinc finger domain-containing protein [Vineibacter sp.]